MSIVRIWEKIKVVVITLHSTVVLRYIPKYWSNTFFLYSLEICQVLKISKQKMNHTQVSFSWDWNCKWKNVQMDSWKNLSLLTRHLRCWYICFVKLFPQNEFVLFLRTFHCYLLINLCILDCMPGDLEFYRHYYHTRLVMIQSVCYEFQITIHPMWSQFKVN